MKPTFKQVGFVFVRQMRRRIWEGAFWGAVMGIAVAAGLTGMSYLGILSLAAFGVLAGIIHAKLLA